MENSKNHGTFWTVAKKQFRGEGCCCFVSDFCHESCVFEEVPFLATFVSVSLFFATVSRWKIPWQIIINYHKLQILFCCGACFLGSDNGRQGWCIFLLNEEPKGPGCLGYIESRIIKLYGDSSKPLEGPQLKKRWTPKESHVHLLQDFFWASRANMLVSETQRLVVLGSQITTEGATCWIFNKDRAPVKTCRNSRLFIIVRYQIYIYPPEPRMQSWQMKILLGIPYILRRCHVILVFFLRFSHPFRFWVVRYPSYQPSLTEPQSLTWHLKMPKLGKGERKIWPKPTSFFGSSR